MEKLTSSLEEWKSWKCEGHRAGKWKRWAWTQMLSDCHGYVLSLTKGPNWAEQYLHLGFTMVSSHVAVLIHFRGGGESWRRNPLTGLDLRFNLISQVRVWKYSMHFTWRMLSHGYFDAETIGILKHSPFQQLLISSSFIRQWKVNSETFLATCRLEPPYFLSPVCSSPHILILIPHIQLQSYVFIYK